MSTKNNIDFQRVRQVLCFVLRYKSNGLIEEHSEECEKYLEKMLMLIERGNRVSKYGNHYLTCPWSNDEALDGPDTCECNDMKRKFRNIEKLINLYKRIGNKWTLTPF